MPGTPAPREGWATRAGLALLCAAYLQGGLSKAWDLEAAVAEMQHFGLQPAGLFALGVMLFEFCAALAVVLGWRRREAAWALAAFTALATLIANPFWAAAPAQRAMLLNGFCEHLGLIGGLWLASRWREAAPPAPA